MSVPKIVGIRAPESALSLEGLADEPITVSPNNAHVPQLALFHIARLIEDEYKEEFEPNREEVYVDLIDLPVETSNKVQPYPKDFPDEVQYGKFTVNKKLIGNIDSIESRVKNADVVFMSSPFTANANPVAITAQKVKEINPSTKIMVGGRDAQNRPDWYLQNGCDVVCLGAGEYLAGKIARYLIENKIESIPYGIATKDFKRGLGKITPHSSDNAKFAKSRTLINKDFDFTLFPQIAFPRLEFKGVEPISDYTFEYNTSSDGPLPKGVKGPVMWYTTSSGCPRTCGFCASAGHPYSYLKSDDVAHMMQELGKGRIKTLLSAEDNFLARLLINEKEGEKEIIEIMNIIKDKSHGGEYGFSHEWTDGLEVGLLMDKRGQLRENVIESVLGHDVVQDRIVGTYRMFWPIETFTRRDEYGKLKAKEEHYRILQSALDQNIPEIGFGTILFHDIDGKELDQMKRELYEFTNYMHKHQGNTKWRLAVFHELPLPGSRDYKKLSKNLAFNIEKHPELWSLPINPLNGPHYNYAELYQIKRDLMNEFDPGLLKAWDKSGKYELSQK